MTDGKWGLVPPLHCNTGLGQTYSCKMMLQSYSLLHFG